MKVIDGRFKHGYGNSRSKRGAYSSWSSMKSRCLNINCNTYYRYGGRGIGVCSRWFDFRNFLADMGDRPKGMTLDRINNDWSYMPSNCRWATHKEQARNKRITKRITDWSTEELICELRRRRKDYTL